MPDCDYCGASFDDEDAYVSHLGAEHEDELGPIDRRKVASRQRSGSDIPTGPIVLVVILLAAAAIVGYTVFAGGGGGGPGGGGGDGPTPGPLGSTHIHGQINVTILNETFDFSRARWKDPRNNPRFHFEGRTDDRWHAHATYITLEYGLSRIGFDVTDDSVTYDGTTYVDGEGYDVSIQVNGNDVDPDYVLEQGDFIEIVVREA